MKQTRKRNHYEKVPKLIKILFLREVLLENSPIKNSAILFKINYSTAKTIIRNYRENPISLNIGENFEKSLTKTPTGYQDRKFCSYRLIQKRQRKQSLDSGLSLQQHKSVINMTPQENIKKIQVISRIQFPEFELTQSGQDLLDLQ